MQYVSHKIKLFRVLKTQTLSDQFYPPINQNIAANSSTAAALIKMHLNNRMLVILFKDH